MTTLMLNDLQWPFFQRSYLQVKDTETSWIGFLLKRMKYLSKLVNTMRMS